MYYKHTTNLASESGESICPHKHHLFHNATKAEEFAISKGDGLEHYRKFGRTTQCIEQTLTSVNRAVSNVLKYQRCTMGQRRAQVRTRPGHVHHETWQITALLKAGRCAPTETDAPNHFISFLLARDCHLVPATPTEGEISALRMPR